MQLMEGIRPSTVLRLFKSNATTVSTDRDGKNTIGLLGPSVDDELPHRTNF